MSCMLKTSLGRKALFPPVMPGLEILLGQEYRYFAISSEEEGTSHGEPFVHPVEVDMLMEMTANVPFDVHNSKESVAFISKSKTSKFILNFLFQK